MDPALHEEARAGDARLPGGDERGEGGALGGGVRVDVVEHDDRGLAAQLSGDPREPGCGRDRGGAARLGATGQGDLGDVRVVRERLADVAAAGHDVHDAVGHAGLTQDLHAGRGWTAASSPTA